MTPEARLRPGRDDDAERFIALIGGCWAEYPGCVMDIDGEVPELRALATYYANHGGALWVAGDISGMVAARPLADGDWELCKMYVAPAQRGSGLAQALVATVEAHARAEGARRLRLWTDTRFDRAHRFYEQQSFVRAGPLRALDDRSRSIEFAYAKPLTGTVVERLDAAAAVSAEARLAQVLAACVDTGASVSFLPPLGREAARAYWRGVSRAVAAGTRVLLAAWHDGVLAGTAMLDLDTSPNQPHHAGLQKLLVAPTARRRGMAQALLQAIEAAARTAGRTLLTLDTREGDDGEALYRRLGWQYAGRIPDFSLNGAGTYDATLLFYKQLA